MPEKHATLSASSAHRWLNCTVSALLEKDKPDTSSDAAKEGTAAHALAEHKLRKALGEKTRRPRKNKYHNQEMEDLTDDYVNYVLEKLAEVKENCPDAVVLVEQKLDYSQWVPGGYGTGDCVIVAEPALHVIDFKYGKGVFVESENNEQMKLYALGAYSAFGMLYDIDSVEATIYQPRRHNVATAEIKVKELLEWAETTAKPAGEKAISGNGDFAPGGEWCGFCRLGATCSARTAYNLATPLAVETKPPAELSDEDTAAILTRLPELEKWIRAIKTHTLNEALAGKQYPGMKLVEGRAVRKYANPDAVADKLTAAGYPENEIYERKLLGITSMESHLGKKQFTELLGDLVERPAGKPALVPETDKRPALDNAPAIDDFQPVK